MPYPFVPTAPDIAKVLDTGDPKWATRAPAFSRQNKHRHAPTRIPGPRKLLLRHVNELHGSEDSYYEYQTAMPCNCTVLSVRDERIQWKCDQYSARQSARPYIDRADAGDIEQSRIVKVARRPGKADTTYVVHPKVFAAVKAETRAPPGDVIAALHRMTVDERNVEIGLLRAGAEVCVYFDE
tara:strand:+ start:167 stop:712 length:546 start_codon:yes stop_codon:yes gene_type:complete